MINDWTFTVFVMLALAGAGAGAASAAYLWRGGDEETANRGAAASLILLVTGLLFGLSTLGHPEMIFGAFSTPSSPLFKELVSLLVLAVSLGGLIVSIRRGAEEGVCKVFEALAMISGAALPLAVGTAFHMSWRPTLDTWVIPAVYLGWAAVHFALVTRAEEISGGEADSCAPASRLPLAAPVILAVLTAAYFAVMSGNCASAGEDNPLPAMMTDGFYIAMAALAALSIAAAFVLGVKNCRTAAPWIAGSVLVIAGSAAFQSIMFELAIPSMHILVD